MKILLVEEYEIPEAETINGIKTFRCDEQKVREEILGKIFRKYGQQNFIHGINLVFSYLSPESRRVEVTAIAG